jgi:hypothetical protein
MVRKRKQWSSRAEESNQLDRSSRRDGVVRRQEFDQSRSSMGDEFDNRLSRAEESDQLDRSSRRDGFVRRQEFDQSRSSRGDGFDKPLSRAEESDRLDRSSRRDGVVRRQEFNQSRSSRGDGVDKPLSRAEESDRLDRSSRRDGVVRRQEFNQSRSSRGDGVDKPLSRAEESDANCFDELGFPDAFDEPDWSAAVAPPFPGRSEFGSDPATVTSQIGTVNNLAIDAARFVSLLCCVLHEDISEANPWIIYR